MSTTLATSTHTLTAANGVAFLARLVLPGDGYGRDGTGPMINDDTRPMVEFFDTRYPHTEFGQFTGGRYFTEPIMLERGAGGLRLNGDSAAWTIDAATMDGFRSWLRAAVAFAAVRETFEAYLDAGYCEPTLMQDFDGREWTIVWEEGPYQWPFLATGGGVDEEMAALGEEFGYTPKPVEAITVPGAFIEPVNHYSIGVYAA